MECYFTSQIFDSESSKHNALITFTIPDVDIVFRAQFNGDEKECEYAALLSLLEFVEINPQLFKNKTIEVFGDSFEVIHQVNEQMYCNTELEPYKKMAQLFKQKVPYVLGYIPPTENPANRYIRAN